MRLTPFEHMNDIHAKLAKASESKLPADERRGAYITAAEEREVDRQMARFAVTSKPSMPGIKGGQDRSGAEIEQDATPLAVGLIGAALCLIAAFFLC